MSLVWTVAGLVFSLLVCALAALMERRPHEPGTVGLVPWPGVLAVFVVAALIFARHLLSLVLPAAAPH